MNGAKVNWRSWMLPSNEKTGRAQVFTGLLALAAPFAGAAWHWWLLALFGYFMYACVGHSVGYHRYFAHRSFAAPRWAEVLFTFCGVLGCVGSPVTWAIMHRRHHLHSDKEGDSYTAHEYPRLGLGALLISNYKQSHNPHKLRRALRRDKFQLWMLRHNFGVVAAFAGLLLALDWRLFLFGWAVPVALTLWMSALDAYATHHWGYKNYKTADESRNLWWMALLFWGEGWHNNHHARPLDWNFRKKWWEFDIGAGVVWVIRVLSGRGVKQRAFSGTKNPDKQAI